MARITLTNMVMVQDKETGKVLVQNIYWDNKNGDKYFTYFYKTDDYTGVKIDATDEGEVFLVDLEKLSEMNLAPNMEKYIKMFRGNYSECYCKCLDNDEWVVTFQ